MRCFHRIPDINLIKLHKTLYYYDGRIAVKRVRSENSKIAYGEEKMKKVGKQEQTAQASAVSRRVINLVYEDAPGKEVFAAGSFNNWKPEKPLLDKDNTGVYRCQLRLEPGTYQYKFMVDGNWCLDENNPNFTPNDFGTLNSLLIVTEKQEK